MPMAESWRVSQVLLRTNLQICDRNARGRLSWSLEQVLGLYWSSWSRSLSRIYLWWDSLSRTNEDCPGVWLGVRLMKLPCTSCYIKPSGSMQMRCRMQPINRELSGSAWVETSPGKEFPTIKKPWKAGVHASSLMVCKLSSWKWEKSNKLEL